MCLYWIQNTLVRRRGNVLCIEKKVDGFSQPTSCHHIVLTLCVLARVINNQNLLAESRNICEWLQIPNYTNWGQQKPLCAKQCSFTFSFNFLLARSTAYRINLSNFIFNILGEWVGEPEKYWLSEHALCLRIDWTLCMNQMKLQFFLSGWKRRIKEKRNKREW